MPLGTAGAGEEGRELTVTVEHQTAALVFAWGTLFLCKEPRRVQGGREERKARFGGGGAREPAPRCSQGVRRSLEDGRHINAKRLFLLLGIAVAR